MKKNNTEYHRITDSKEEEKTREHYKFSRPEIKDQPTLCNSRLSGGQGTKCQALGMESE